MCIFLNKQVKYDTNVSFEIYMINVCLHQAFVSLKYNSVCLQSMIFQVTSQQCRHAINVAEHTTKAAFSQKCSDIFM